MLKVIIALFAYSVGFGSGVRMVWKEAVKNGVAIEEKSERWGFKWITKDKEKGKGENGL